MMATAIAMKKLLQGTKPTFGLEKVKGPVKLTEDLVIHPFETTQVSRISKLKVIL